MKKKGLLGLAIGLGIGAFSQPTWATEVVGTVASGYIFPKYAGVASTSPVANLSVTFDNPGCLSSNVWAQAGDRPSTEVDLVATCSYRLGKVQTHVSAGVYLTALNPAYTVSASADVPIGDATLSATAETFTGSFEDTVFSVSISKPIKLSRHFMPTISIGKAWNSYPNEQQNPWFLSVSHSLGSSKYAPVLCVGGFWGATGSRSHSAVYLSISKTF